MTYLEILGWARKGIQADKAKHREMQEKALRGRRSTSQDTARKLLMRSMSSWQLSMRSKTCTTESEGQHGE